MIIVKELVASFPEFSDKIHEYYHKSHIFKELTEDYLYCKQKIARLSLDSTENRTLLDQYEKTMEELAEELVLHLSNEEQQSKEKA